MDTIASIVDLYDREGAAAYLGEAVTQTEHALQSAWAAERAGAADALVCAALLHDVGHLLHGLPEDCADQGVDDRHERVGAGWLRRTFSAAVTEPIRLHVEAKRYLCAVEPAYRQLLSTASVQSLALQGGPMTPDAVREFAALPHAMDAVVVRRWDEEAKVEGLTTPDLGHFRACMERCRVAVS